MVDYQIDHQIESIILTLQKFPPINIIEVARLVGIGVQADPNPPEMIKRSKGKSWGRIVMYPFPIIYYNKEVLPPNKIKFVTATLLSYWVLFNDRLKKTNGCEFYRLFWSEHFKNEKERKKALRYAADLLVPKQALKEILRVNTFDSDINTMAKYFGVQPSLISIVLGIPYE